MARKWRNGYIRPNPEHDRQIRSVRDKRNRSENKRLFIEFKKTLSCIRCGEKHPATLDFHHKDPNTKTLEVSVMVFNRTWKRVLAEIAKCEVLCANCHRIEHWVES